MKILKWFKRLFIIVVVMLIIAGLALVVGPRFVPDDTYKRHLAEQIEKHTGYKAAFEGVLDVNILPSTSVNVEGMTLVGPNGVTHTLDGFTVSVNPLAYFMDNLNVALSTRVQDIPVFLELKFFDVPAVIKQQPSPFSLRFEAAEDALTVAGNLALKNQKTTLLLTDLNIAINHMLGSGEIELVQAGVPSVKANLVFNQADIKNLMTLMGTLGALASPESAVAMAQEEAETVSEPNATAGDVSAEASLPTSLPVWEKEIELPVAMLSAFVADIRLQAGQVIDQGRVWLEDVELTYKQDASKAKVDMVIGRLFDGRAKVMAEWDGTEQPSEVSLEADVESANIQKIAALAGQPNIEGTGRMVLELEAEGTHVKALYESLEGEVTVNLSPVIYKGLNVTRWLTEQNVLNAALATEKDARTDIRLIEAQASIMRDQLKFSRLGLDSDGFEAVGNGDLWLLRDKIDLDVMPKLKALENTLTALGKIVVHVTGKLSAPTIKTEIGGAANIEDVLKKTLTSEDPKAELKKLEKGIKEDLRNLEDTLKEGLGGFLDKF